MAGMTFDELPLAAGELSLVRRMHHGGDFVIDPLPNLLFTRDSSFWIGPRVAITVAGAAGAAPRVVADRSRSMPTTRGSRARGGPTSRARHPSRAVTCCCSRRAWSPSGSGSGPHRRVRKRWRAALFDDGLAHTVLAVPIAQQRARCTSTPSARWSTPTPW